MSAGGTCRILFLEVFMISVGIDISKGKSIIIALKPGDELVLEPKELQHTKEGLKKLGDWIETQSEEVRVVMEATGRYHTSAS